MPQATVDIEQSRRIACLEEEVQRLHNRLVELTRQKKPDETDKAMTKLSGGRYYRIKCGLDDDEEE